jgi:poly(ADP-ribose) glycohydrolase ARH3
MRMMRVDLKGKFLGGKVGSALGDAIGELAFRYPDRDRLIAVVEQAETLTYTDDTAMAIGLAESILEKNGIDSRHPMAYSEALFCAVLNGGGRDTLGAMAGAISGAYLGIEAVPKSWREKLENREKIEALASSLFQISVLK